MQQGAAVIAAPLLPAERFGPAGDDVGDGATMRWQHRRAVSRQIAAPETAENVRHFGHASEAAHHLVEQLAQRHPRRFRQMRVNRRRGDVLAAGVVRDAQVRAGLAALDMTAQRRRSAALDRRHDLELAEAHMAGMGRTPSRPAVAEDVRHLDRHGTSPWAEGPRP